MPSHVRFFQKYFWLTQPLNAERLVEWPTLGGNESVGEIPENFIRQVLEYVSQVKVAVTTENWENLTPTAGGLKGICLEA